jgi:DNA helicase-2/ATP-dependent DNA helicase PcrA
MLDLNQLNPEQRHCVSSIQGPLLLLAGAGTGKTKVITSRIANMIAHGIAPQKIVALTFTNKAAREMQERIQHLIGPKAKHLTVGTFHSFCLKILREFHYEASLDKRFAIAGSSDQLNLVRKALEEKGWSGAFRAETLQQAISFAKNQLWDAETLLENYSQNFSSNYDPAIAAEVYKLYERQLKLNRVIDFDDCIYKVVNLLRTNSQVKTTLEERYQYLSVDEFQDTNLAQLKVIEALAAKHQNVCVVGDDDQSIYSWRGAMAEVLIRYEEIFPTRKLIKLEQNYRCTTTILEAANKVIKNNSQRKDKALWTKKEKTSPINLFFRLSEADEAHAVAERCMGLLGRGYKPSDICVLYRANSQNKALEFSMREFQLSYKVFGGQSFFENKEVKDVLAYLRLIVNHSDRLSFWRVINYPNRGLGLKTLEKIEAIALEKKISPFAVLQKFRDQLPERVRATAEEFVANIEKFKLNSIASGAQLSGVVSQIIRDFHLRSAIKVGTQNEKSADKKLDALLRLPDWIGNLADRILAREEELDLYNLLDSLTLDDRKDEDKDTNRDYISLMTIHAAKGLEFPVVFVVGLEEDLFPHKNSTTTPQGLAEERRLFYVALTRAKELLFLSHCMEKSQGPQKVVVKRSRFLDELPLETLDLSETVKTPVSVEEKRERTLSRLSKLRSEIIAKP